MNASVVQRSMLAAAAFLARNPLIHEMTDIPKSSRDCRFLVLKTKFNFLSVLLTFTVTPGALMWLGRAGFSWWEA